MLPSRRHPLARAVVALALPAALAPPVSHAAPPTHAAFAANGHAVPAADGHAAPDATSKADRARASAELAACHVAGLQIDRSATFRAEMRALPGSGRMALRFDAFVRRAGARRFRRVRAPGLGVWRRSDPGVAAFGYTQRLTNLEGPAAYRAQVRFRWYAPDGTLLRSARRVTRACRVPDLRADLSIGAIAIRPAADPAHALYEITVRNGGATDAAGFDVGLRVGRLELPPVTVLRLAPGARARVEIEGPRCAPGELVVAVADPDRRVPERDETDNSRRASCPRPSAR